MTGGRAQPGVATCTMLLLLALGGCSNDAGLLGSSDAPAKRELGLTRDWNLFVRNDAKVRAVQAADLVGADGHCASEGAPPSAALNFQAGPDISHGGATPPISPAPAAAPPAHGIGLGATECEVVAALGHTDRVEISTNEHGGRRAVLTYLQGNHAGIYQFDDGRLKSIERAPQAETPQKPVKPRRGGGQSAGN